MKLPGCTGDNVVGITPITNTADNTAENSTSMSMKKHRKHGPRPSITRTKRGTANTKKRLNCTDCPTSLCGDVPLGEQGSEASGTTANPASVTDLQDVVAA